MNSVGLPKGMQPRFWEGGGNLSQRNNNITNDFVSVGIAQNEYALFIIMGYLSLLLKWNSFFFANLKISNFRHFENVADHLHFQRGLNSDRHLRKIWLWFGIEVIHFTTQWHNQYQQSFHK